MSTHYTTPLTRFQRDSSRGIVSTFVQQREKQAQVPNILHIPQHKQQRHPRRFLNKFEGRKEVKLNELYKC